MNSNNNFTVPLYPIDQCKLVESIVKSNQRRGSYGSAVKCMKGWTEDSRDEEYRSVKHKRQRDSSSNYVFKPKTPYRKSLSRGSTFYCSDCERYFQSHFNYTQHLKFDTKHQKSKTTHLATPGPETSYPSKFIESTYQYQDQVQTAPMTPPLSPEEPTKEEEESPVTAMLNNYLIPDRNDPNNYCNSYDYSFYSKALFHFHLSDFHSIATTKPANCPFD